MPFIKPSAKSGKSKKCLIKNEADIRREPANKRTFLKLFLFIKTIFELKIQPAPGSEKSVFLI